MSVSIGAKIRTFRQSRNLSQTELELSIQAASGSISRIESGTTNPTKETIWAISDFLQLDVRELEYLFGNLDNLVTEDEIKRAKSQVKELFEKPGFLGYLLDDRYRMIYVSDTFYRLLDQKPENIEGRTIIEIILDPKYKIRDAFDPEYLELTIKTVIERFYADSYFMLEDEYIKESVDRIKADPIANKYFKEIASNKLVRGFHTQEERRAYFKFFGIKFVLSYSANPLYGLTRFSLVEYYKDSLLFKMMSKFI